MTIWATADLEERLCRALDLAEVVLKDFGTHGYSDAQRPEFSFGPEKVVAETAMLVYAASDVSESSALRARVDRVIRQLIPYVRSKRALADMALQPERSFKHALPHALLTSLGHPDVHLDWFFKARCSNVIEMAGDLPPTAQMEREWIARHVSLDESVGGPCGNDSMYGSFLDLPVHLLSGSREDAYSLTHILFYVTDFGRTPLQVGSRPVGIMLDEIEALLLHYMDAGDYDLSGELLMAWPQLHAKWSPVAAFIFRVLARIENEVGVLPCGNTDVERFNQLDEIEGVQYARAMGYHTAFVMGFLCAVSLRNGSLPPTTVEGQQYPDSVWKVFWDEIDDKNSHWVQDFIHCGTTEKRALAPMLCHFAIIQRLRDRDYKRVDHLLKLADDAELPAHPLRTQAADILSNLGAAMTIFAQKPNLPSSSNPES